MAIKTQTANIPLPHHDHVLISVLKKINEHIAYMAIEIKDSKIILVMACLICFWILAGSED
jgi:hypothetical protein